MNSLKDMIIFSVLTSIFVLAVINCGVYEHELAHKAIFQSYGIKSVITMNYLGNGYTQPVNLKNGTLTKEEVNQMNGYHIWNEIVGYHLQPIFLCMAIITMCILYSTIFKEEGDKL